MSPADAEWMYPEAAGVKTDSMLEDPSLMEIIDAFCDDPGYRAGVPAPEAQRLDPAVHDILHPSAPVPDHPLTPVDNGMFIFGAPDSSRSPCAHAGADGAPCGGASCAACHTFMSKRKQQKEKNRLKQAAYRRKLKGQKQGLEASIQKATEKLVAARATRERLTAAKATLLTRSKMATHALNSAVTAAAADAPPAPLSHMPPRSNSGSHSPDDTSATASALDVRPHRSSNMFPNAPGIPKPLESYRFTASVSHEDILPHLPSPPYPPSLFPPPSETSMRMGTGHTPSHTPGDSGCALFNAVSVIRDALEHFQHQTHVRLGSATETAWFVQFPFEVAPGVRLSQSTTMASPACHLSATLAFWAITLESSFLTYAEAFRAGAVFEEKGKGGSGAYSYYARDRMGVENLPNHSNAIPESSRSYEHILPMPRVPRRALVPTPVDLPRLRKYGITSGERQRTQIERAVRSVVHRIVLRYRNSLPKEIWRRLCMQTMHALQSQLACVAQCAEFVESANAATDNGEVPARNTAGAGATAGRAGRPRTLRTRGMRPCGDNPCGPGVGCCGVRGNDCCRKAADAAVAAGAATSVGATLTGLPDEVIKDLHEAAVGAEGEHVEVHPGWMEFVARRAHQAAPQTMQGGSGPARVATAGTGGTASGGAGSVEAVEQGSGTSAAAAPEGDGDGAAPESSRRQGSAEEGCTELWGCPDAGMHRSDYWDTCPVRQAERHRSTGSHNAGASHGGGEVAQGPQPSGEGATAVFGGVHEHETFTSLLSEGVSCEGREPGVAQWLEAECLAMASQPQSTNMASFERCCGGVCWADVNGVPPPEDSRHPFRYPDVADEKLRNKEFCALVEVEVDKGGERCGREGANEDAGEVARGAPAEEAGVQRAEEVAVCRWEDLRDVAVDTLKLISVAVHEAMNSALKSDTGDAIRHAPGKPAVSAESSLQAEDAAMETMKAEVEAEGDLDEEWLKRRSREINVSTSLCCNALLADAPVTYRHMTQPPVLAISYVERRQLKVYQYMRLTRGQKEHFAALYRAWKVRRRALDKDFAAAQAQLLVSLPSRLPTVPSATAAALQGTVDDPATTADASSDPLRGLRWADLCLTPGDGQSAGKEPLEPLSHADDPVVSMYAAVHHAGSPPPAASQESADSVMYTSTVAQPDLRAASVGSGGQQHAEGSIGGGSSVAAQQSSQTHLCHNCGVPVDTAQVSTDTAGEGREGGVLLGRDGDAMSAAEAAVAAMAKVHRADHLILRDYSEMVTLPSYSLFEGEVRRFWAALLEVQVPTVDMVMLFRTAAHDLAHDDLFSSIRGALL